MSVLIKSPPVFQGSSIEQVKQMYAYLYQMSEQINYALNSLDSGSVADNNGKVMTVVGTTSQSGESPEYSTETYNELRALIQKTGTAVNESMASLKVEFGNQIDDVNKNYTSLNNTVISNNSDLTKRIEDYTIQTNSNFSDVNDSIAEVNEATKSNSELLSAQNDLLFANTDAINQNTSDISQNKSNIQTNATNISQNTTDIQKNQQDIKKITLSLENDYLLSSAFGSYKEEQKAALEASASGLVQSYRLDTVLSTADEVANFKTWQTTTDSFIKTGLLYYDEYGVGKYGVAIGENLSQVIIDGVVVKEQSNLLATFTANKLSFWMYGVEAAYFSNKTLYVTDAKIKGSLEVANLLITKNEKGTVIRWVGD